MPKDEGHAQESKLPSLKVDREQTSLLFDFTEIEDDRSTDYKRALQNVLGPSTHSRESKTSFKEASSERKPSTNASFTPIKKRIIGFVVSAKMDKTVVVKSRRESAHPIYVRRIRTTKKFYTHDEFNMAREGDFVQIVECRPMSKTKRWRLEAILRRPGISKEVPTWLHKPALIRFSIPELSGSHMVVDHVYRLRVHLENDQYDLFKSQMTGRQSLIQLTDRKTEAAYEPHHQNLGTLFVRLGSPRFETVPSVIKMAAGTDGPVFEPSEVSIKARQKGTFDFNVSVLLASTGELVQSQIFKLTVD